MPAWCAATIMSPAIIYQIQQSFIWDDAVIIVTYAANGGIWDHVAPPKIDRWGPGTRVPTIIISPFAKRHFVDHTTYDTTSILKLIETRWGLTPLETRDANSSRSDQRPAAGVILVAVGAWRDLCLQLRQPVAVLRIVPALEVRRALLGERGARFHQVALGAVLVQRGGQALLSRPMAPDASAASCAPC